MKALICPHCDSRVWETAHVCAGCGAEIVRDASRRERVGVGVLFAFGAFVVASVVLRAMEIRNGASFLKPNAADALPFFVGLFAVLLTGYLIGKGIVGFLRRSQVRFFRSYRGH